MINTKFTYLYRDAGNYKRFKSVVLRGELFLEAVQDYLEDHDKFIAEQVGLESPQTGWDEDNYEFPTEDDHVWCEVCPDGFEPTNDEPTVSCTADELVVKFQQAHEAGWDVSAAMESLGLQ